VERKLAKGLGVPGHVADLIAGGIGSQKGLFECFGLSRRW